MNTTAALPVVGVDLAKSVIYMPCAHSAPTQNSTKQQNAGAERMSPSNYGERARIGSLLSTH